MRHARSSCSRRVGDRLDRLDGQCCAEDGVNDQITLQMKLSLRRREKQRRSVLPRRTHSPRNGRAMDNAVIDALANPLT